MNIQGRKRHLKGSGNDHYSIVNQFGNAIAATTTLNAGYGSSITV
jgi:gamma-glutamyltranspeptidase/glutathione hydrolase